MRIFLVLCAAVIVGVGGYFGYGLKSEINAMNASASLRKDADRDGVRWAMSMYPDYAFDQVVLGPGETDATREFRARVVRGGIAQASYGVVATDCPEDGSVSGAACWRLTRLVIDGVEVPEISPADAPVETSLVSSAPIEATSGAAPADETRREDVLASQPLEVTPDASEDGTLGGSDTETAAAGQPAEDTAALAAATPSLVASHRVRLQIVNARREPNGEIATRLTRNTGLALLETRRGWGRFRVLDGDDRDLEIWVAFSVLDPA